MRVPSNNRDQDSIITDSIVTLLGGTITQTSRYSSSVIINGLYYLAWISDADFVLNAQFKPANENDSLIYFENIGDPDFIDKLKARILTIELAPATVF